MTPKHQRRIVLSAGEECTVAGSGLVNVALLTGVLHIAGVLLEANCPYSFHLYPERRSIILFTLEGGSASITSEHPVELFKHATGAASLVQLVRRTLLLLNTSRVLVIGKHRSGKTLAAHTIANLLRHYAAERGEGDLLRVFLLDINAETNCLFSPGCFSFVEVRDDPLWLGNAASPTRLPLSFFLGTATRPSAKDIGIFIHFCEQLYDTCAGFVQEKLTHSLKYHLVLDAPSPLGDLKEDVFYKKIIEIVRPTHVVIVGSRDDASESWTTFLQEDVQRILPDCEFAFTEPCSRPCPLTTTTLLLEEFFVGTPSTFLLGCSKVVVSTKALQFVEYTMELGAAEGGGVRRVYPEADWRFMVCALSHAEMMEEVPLAPVAGLFVICHVDEENDELVLLAPASEDALQRRFVILPRLDGTQALKMTETQLTRLEGTVTV